MEDNQLHISILKELSDIKSSLSVNTNETSNIKARVSETQSDVKEALQAIKIQNGRVRTLEDWANEAKKVIENTTKTAADTLASYKSDRTKILAGAAIALFLGGTIVTLSIMAINSKIKDGINEVLSTYNLTKDETDN